MQKLFIAFCGLLCIFSCNNSSNAPIEVTPIDVLVPDTLHIGNYVLHVDTVQESDFVKLNNAVAYDTLESVNISRDSQQVSRVDDTLFFATQKGVVTLTNNHADDDTYARYEYYGKLNSAFQYVSFGSFYEWFNYFLISEKTGDTTVLWGAPEISPDNKMLIAVNADIEAGFTINGIQLFEIIEGKLHSVGERRITDWGPEEVRWVNARELIIKRQFLHYTNNSSYRYDYIRLSF